MRRALYIFGATVLVLATLAFLVQYPNYKRAKQHVLELRARDAAKSQMLAP